MKKRFAGLFLGLLSLTACKTAPIAPIPAGDKPPPNPVETISVTRESCKQTFEEFARIASTDPKRYENNKAAEERINFNNTIQACKEHDYLTQEDMIEVMKKIGPIKPPEIKAHPIGKISRPPGAH